MITLAWRHGLRASEVCSLRVKDIDLAGFITVQRLKGSLRTTQPLFPEEKLVLATLCTDRRPAEYLFPGRFSGHITRQVFFLGFQKACQEAGIPAHLAHPHALKHTTGMTVIQKGIENARQYLGHKSIASTGAYLKVSDQEASRAAAAAFGD